MNSSKEIRVFARGGLGNQLFQYGAAVNLSKTLNLPIVVDDLFLSKATNNKNVGYRVLELDSFENDLTFNFRDESTSNKFLSKLLSQQRLLGDRFPKLLLKFGFFSNERKENIEVFKLIKKSVKINSYCGNRAFFGYFEHEIIRAITSVKSPTNWFLETKRKILESEPIGVHVRLGDYQNFASIYGNPDVDYYQNAIATLKNLNGNRPVWLFSDEPNRAEALFRGDLKFDVIVQDPQKGRAIEHLNLLGHCKNIVCANSSFSWWAGFIATQLSPNSKIVFPRPMFNSSEVSEPFNWLPENWITLGRKF